MPPILGHKPSGTTAARIALIQGHPDPEPTRFGFFEQCLRPRFAFGEAAAGPAAAEAEMARLARRDAA
jgi:hypothetical protein